ncbi:MAG: Hsp20/alpha crystallin family protein [Bacteroidales bacterium]|nr:Hsp20/alpha crystallin family protein [Bacteroidales bacterium]
MLPMLRRSRVNVPSLMDEFFGRDLMQNFFEDQTGISMPAVNVVETNDNFRIEVAAPGLEKKDFKIDLDNNVLTISSEKEERNESQEEGKFMRREFSYSSFRRSFSLPNSVDAEKIKANHKDGILSIILPKREEAKQKPPKQISIS